MLHRRLASKFQKLEWSELDKFLFLFCELPLILTRNSSVPQMSGKEKRIFWILEKNFPARGTSFHRNRILWKNWSPLEVGQGLPGGEGGFFSSVSRIFPSGLGKILENLLFLASPSLGT